MKRINGEDTSTVSPTLGFNIKTMQFHDGRLNIWDVGGQKTLRSYWRNYYEQVCRHVAQRPGAQSAMAGLLWPSGLLLLLHKNGCDMPAAVAGYNQPARLLWAGPALLECGASKRSTCLGSPYLCRLLLAHQLQCPLWSVSNSLSHTGLSTVCS